MPRRCSSSTRRGILGMEERRILGVVISMIVNPERLCSRPRLPFTTRTPRPRPARHRLRLRSVLYPLSGRRLMLVTRPAQERRARPDDSIVMVLVTDPVRGLSDGEEVVLGAPPSSRRGAALLRVGDGAAEPRPRTVLPPV